MKHRTRYVLWLLGAIGIFIIAVILSFVLAIGPPNTHKKVLPEAFDRKFPPEQLRAELAFMLQTLEDVHPDLYHYTSKQELHACADSIAQELTLPITRKQFYPYVARLAARVGDGHTNAVPPREEWQHFLETNGHVFPFDIKKAENGVQVKTVYGDSLPILPGDRIVAINGVAADSLFHDFLRRTSGEKQAFRQAVVERRFRTNLWLTGITSPYRVRWVSAATGEVAQALVSGVTGETIRAHAKSSSRKAQFYTYERLQENIGYIDFRAMKDLDGFKRFLEETSTRIRADSLRGLIIDLRKNGGGSTQLGDELLSYITDKPYRFTSKMQWKVSKQLKAYLRGFIPAWVRWLPLQYVHPVGRKIWRTPEGEMAVWHSQPRPPRDNPLRYDGPVCVLIGPFTFSSAMKLANVIKDFEIATLIGEETGGIPNAFGEVYTFDLPATRLQVGVSTKQFSRANGDLEDKRGVLPDFEVRQTDADLQKGIDTVLEFAKGWVLGGGITRND